LMGVLVGVQHRAEPKLKGRHRSCAARTVLPIERAFDPNATVLIEVNGKPALV
jgi:hypothetical protein